MKPEKELRSIIGPVLYAIFISPLFDIEKLTYYADDGFGLVSNKDKKVLVTLMEKKLERTESWLRKSGMKVNVYVCFTKMTLPQLKLNLIQQQSNLIQALTFWV